MFKSTFSCTVLFLYQWSLNEKIRMCKARKALYSIFQIRRFISGINLFLENLAIHSQREEISGPIIESNLHGGLQKIDSKTR